MLAATALAQSSSPAAATDPFQPPPHTLPFPDLGYGETREARLASYDGGPQFHRGTPMADTLRQRRRLEAALAQLTPQRPGAADVYIVTIALDSDPVFAREAREAAKVLAHRYNGAGRTLALAGPDGMRDELPHGTMDGLAQALVHIGGMMDRDEDVLVLYTTSHGLDLGLAYHYGDSAYGIASPAWLKSVLDEAGITRRILIISACYSGVFVPVLSSPDTAILTAAASTRTSFGCEAENDWTFFGDALINRALRKPVSLADAARQAGRDVAAWEITKRYPASLPQVAIGNNVASWLGLLEARIPQVVTAPVGRPAFAE